MLRSLVVCITSAVVLVDPFGTGCAHAQPSFPQRTIRIVTHASPGTWDIYARVITPRLAEALGQPVIIENRVGANGNIAMLDVARAQPDGHTLLYAATGALTINTAVFEPMPLDPLKELDAVAIAATVPMIWVASPKSSVRSLVDYVKLARGAPGKVDFALAANGSLNHLIFEGLRQLQNLEIVTITYKSTPPAQQDVIAGNVPVMVDSLGAAMGHIRAGTVVPLAVTTRLRADSLPSVPTVIELGLDNREYTGWYGFLAPRGTPRDVVQRLNAEINRAMALPEPQEKIRALGAQPAAMTPDQFQKFMLDERSKWGAIAKAGNVRVQ
ncbi:MAG: tripartite tricarboxylate transporter substrate binding protein [Proteobacteria bacterium]|nr:tripartite tricarboxylate transporter substrate binding protein [Burkholderiales bacterium]